MNIIFVIMIVLSLVFALGTGRLPQLSQATMTQAQSAVTLVISLTGMMCLWGGLMKIAQESGLTDILRKLLSPITRHLFKGLNPKGEAVSAITMNIVANLLGLGNAATPLGLKAMHEISKEQSCKKRASDDMIVFVVINTAAVQLIPATVAMLRQQAGSQTPLDILPAVWITSIVSVTVAVVVTKLISSVRREKT